MCRVDILSTHIVSAWSSLENRVRQCRHARQRGCSGRPPTQPRAPSGAPRCGEHVGAHPVAGDLTANEIRSSEVLSLSVTLTSGVGDPLSAAGGLRWVEIRVFLAFFVPDLNWFF